MTLFRLVSPDAMVTEERGTSKRFAKNSMQASLARPSTGGAVKASFSASPIVPVMAFFLARGCTFTAKATPAEVSRTGIINSDFTTEAQRTSTHKKSRGIALAHIPSFVSFCVSVTLWLITCSTFPRRSRFPRVRRSTLLQSRLQNRATSPSRAHAY
jgi:hypothetical protein